MIGLLSRDEISKSLRQALNSDPHYARAIIQGLLVDLDPPDPTLEERVDKIESMTMELICGLKDLKGSATAQRIHNREYEDD